MDDLPNPKPPPELQFAPGLRVVGRGREQLQIGLYDERRVLLPRTETVESTVDALLAHRPLESDPQTAAVLDRLQAHGCLTGRGDHRWRQQRRRRGRVGVVGDLAGLDATGLLRTVGIPTVTGAVGEVDVVLVLSTGEIARERLDPFLRRGTAHLLARLVDGAALVGPFVVPGHTACLRCIDAHQSIRDPDHVVVTSRYVRATSQVRADGVPDVADPLLAWLAIAWAVRDVAAHLEGRRPSTWSRTLFLGPEPSRRREEDWSRHPDCGCSWSADARPSGTMGV